MSEAGKTCVAEIVSAASAGAPQRRTASESAKDTVLFISFPPPVVRTSRGILTSEGDDGLFGFRANRARAPGQAVPPRLSRRPLPHLRRGDGPRARYLGTLPRAQLRPRTPCRAPAGELPGIPAAL